MGGCTANHACWHHKPQGKPQLAGMDTVIWTKNMHTHSHSSVHTSGLGGHSVALVKTKF